MPKNDAENAKWAEIATTHNMNTVVLGLFAFDEGTITYSRLVLRFLHGKSCHITRFLRTLQLFVSNSNNNLKLLQYEIKDRFIELSIVNFVCEFYKDKVFTDEDGKLPGWLYSSLLLRTVRKI